VLGGVAVVTSPDVTSTSGKYGQGDKVLVPLGSVDVVFGSQTASGGGPR
jgi:hypothetical protein